MSDSSLDLESIRELKEIMEDDFEILVTTFLSDSESKLPQLDQALSAASAEELCELAHSIKGASSNIGTPKLAGICKQLEDQTRNKDLTQASELVEQIKQEFAVVKEQLNNEI